MKRPTNIMAETARAVNTKEGVDPASKVVPAAFATETVRAIIFKHINAAVLDSMSVELLLAHRRDQCWKLKEKVEELKQLLTEKGV